MFASPAEERDMGAEISEEMSSDPVKADRLTRSARKRKTIQDDLATTMLQELVNGHEVAWLRGPRKRDLPPSHKARSHPAFRAPTQNLSKRIRGRKFIGDSDGIDDRSPPPTGPPTHAKLSLPEGLGHHSVESVLLPSLAAAGLTRTSASKRQQRLAAFNPILLPEPTGLVMTSATTTSLAIRWAKAPAKLQSSAPMLYWAVDCQEQSDTPTYNETRKGKVTAGKSLPGGDLAVVCPIPLASRQAFVYDLMPSKSYTVRLRLEQWNGLTLVSHSSWVSIDASTLEISAVPNAPLRPVVHRTSSTTAQVTILRVPCNSNGSFACAEAYVIQKSIDAGAGSGSMSCSSSSEEDETECRAVRRRRGHEWGTVTSVACVCSHPTTPEVVSSLDKVEVDLQVGKVYRFRCRAMNSLDNSPWSEVAILLPPPEPPAVRLEQVSAKMATLVWEAPEKYGFDVQHYHVYVRKLDDNSESSVKEAVILATSSQRDNDNNEQQAEAHHAGDSSLVTYHARNLMPKTKYEITVRAKSDGGLSDTSLAVEVETLPVPPPMPSNLCPGDIQPTSLVLSWSFDSGAELGPHNEAEYSQVQWKLAGEDGEEHWETMEVMDGMTCKVNNLHVDTLYDMRVRGCNLGGLGAWSAVWKQRTSVHPPMTPTNFTCEHVKSTAVTVSWDSVPSDPHYPVLLYQVRCAPCSSSDPETCWATIMTIESADTTRLSKVVEDLEPGQTFSVQLRAVNSYGPGGSTSPVLITTLCEVPPPPSQPVSESVEANDAGLLLSWSAPQCFSGSEASRLVHGARIEEYRVQMCKYGSKEWQTIHEGSDETQCVVRGVLASTIYYFRVQARNSVGWSQWSDEGEETTPASPPPKAPEYVVCETTHHSTTLQWQSQPDSTSYEVHQLKDGVWVSSMHARRVISEQLARGASASPPSAPTEEVSPLKKQKREGMMLTYTKDYLVEDTVYTFRVVSIGAGGQSFSPDITAVTKSMSWAKRLSEAERGLLRDMCIKCEATEVYDALEKALCDTRTLATLTPAELERTFEILNVLPKHQERIRRILCTPPPPPSAPATKDSSFNSLVLSWDTPKCAGSASLYPITEYCVRFHTADCPLNWTEIRCGHSPCTVPGLSPGSRYVFQVAAANEPCGRGEWSAEASGTTAEQTCGDERLLSVVTRAVNTQAYAKQVCAMLYGDEWTLERLKLLDRARLCSVLRSSRIKEGAVRSICMALDEDQDEDKMVVQVGGGGIGGEL